MVVGALRRGSSPLGVAPATVLGGLAGARFMLGGIEGQRPPARAGVAEASAFLPWLGAWGAG